MQPTSLSRVVDEEQYHRCQLISIDAWKEPEGGWFWNDLNKIEEGIYIAEDSKVLNSSRSAIKYFRENLGVLNDNSKGKVSIDFNNDIMDGVLLVVSARGTGEPLFALSSVHG